MIFILKQLKESYVKYGNLTPSPRMAKLINGYGKGFHVYEDTDEWGYKLHQWDTHASNSIANIWSWNEASLGSGDRHLCNGFGKCVGSWKIKVLANNGTLNWDQMGWELLKQWNYENVDRQRFHFHHSLTHLGFYVIKDEFGKCIGIPENTSRNGAEIRACYCNSSEVSQRWKWHYLPAPAHRAKLINSLGKCAAMDPRNRNNNLMHQWNCERIKDDAMLWSWNETSLSSGDRHICNGRGMCFASYADVDYSIHLIGYYPKNEHKI